MLRATGRGTLRLLMLPVRCLALVALLFAASNARAAELPRLWKVPSFAFEDEAAKPFTDANLHGRVWIADFIYTQCTSACPVLTAKMKLMQRKVQGHAVWFLSFSVDPAHDTPAALAAYASEWRADASHWKLLSTGNDASLRALIRGMHTDLSNSAGPGSPIMHSESFLLIDADGQVRGRYDSTDPDDLARLVQEATALADALQQREAPIAAGTPRGSAAEQGKELYETLGCRACHAREEVAPPLRGLAGAMVKLHDADPAVADDAYLRSSILDPDKDVVAGYPATMPSYRNNLTGPQVEALVAFLNSIGGPKNAGAATSERIRAVDPVCKMPISASTKGPTAQYQGKTYYFCSADCQKRFEQAPARYAPATK